jgi:16S rRNA (adenine1518-N6/adenine1519-N6)-dimethyltransferase
LKVAVHRPRRRFGQHFLRDESVLERMAAALALRADDHVLEIGPGQGALTERILAGTRHLVVVEIDRDLVAALRGRFPQLTIVEGDVLAVDVDVLIERGHDVRVVGNLPYNISTPLLIRLLDVAGRVRDMHFLLQKEVVDRLAARSGTKDYGRLTVMVQRVLNVDPLFDVRPESFRPAPKVMSTFVRLWPRPQVEVVDEASFARLVQTGFQQRRKRLSNALQSIGIDWSRAPVDPGLRADAVDVAGWVALANYIGETKPPNDR